MLNFYTRKANLTQIFLNWLVFMIAITFLSGLAYVLDQQNLRQAANDPQIQMAEDTATALSGGKPIQAVLPTHTVNMANSLAPYLIIYDVSGKPLASSVQLDGSTPDVPPGVFSDVAPQSQNRFTWQPETGVRSAAVLVHFSGVNSGFVLAGRSLREVEKREEQLYEMVGLIWLALCLVTTLIFASPFILSFRSLKPGR